jgi:hypothetical protein
MPIYKNRVTKILSLDLSDIPADQQEDAKAEVMDFLKEQMLSDIGEAKSPVTGRAFRKLSKDYAEYKEGESSSVIPNMELTGEMLDALEVEDRGGSKIEIGWFEEDQAAKAFNHTTGDTVPKRPLIPTPSQEFRPGILEEIENILGEYRVQD